MRATAWADRTFAGRYVLVFLLWIALGYGATLSAAPSRQVSLPVASVQEAFKAGEIDAWAEPIGIGFRQPMVRLHLFNRVQAERTIYVPMGTVLAAPSTAFADLVIADAMTVSVPSHVGIEINAFSLAYDRGFPSATGTYSYTVGSIADSQLVARLASIATQSSKQEFGAQLAVWSWSSGIPLKDLAQRLSVPPMPEDIEQAGRLQGGTDGAVVAPTNVSPHGTGAPDGATPAQPGEPTPTSDPGGPFRVGCPGLFFLGFLVVALIAASAWLVGRKQVLEVQAPKRPIPEPHPQEDKAQASGITPGQSVSDATRSPETTGRPAGSVEPIMTPAGDEVDADATQTPAATELVATRGPLLGKHWPLTGQHIISRGEVSWLVIPDLAISVPHVALDMAAPAPRIKDLASKNGVTLDGNRLDDGFSPVTEGQTIGIGSLQLMLGKNLLQVTQGSLKGKSYSLSTGMTTISRERLPMIVTGAQDRAISDLHVLLSLEGQTVSVKDLNSSNGTLVDGTPVQEGTLRPESCLTLGSSEFRVQIRFGMYTLLSLLGEGGMARVYLAENEHRVRRALKIPNDSRSDLKLRFMRESKNHCHLEHANIVKVHETGEVGGRPYVAMQYIDGGNLQTRLGDGKPLPLNMALRIAREVADALDYAYSQDVIFHRDIKPSNILLDKQGKAYLTDFGIAKALQDLDITQTTDVLGTVYYMSPEQAQGGKKLDKRTDIYSLGVVLYQMLAGVVPFDTTSSKPAILLKHISEPPPPLREANSDVPEQVVQIVEKCLAKSPDDRYQSARALSEALKTVGGG